MIYDKFENTALYFADGSRLGRALDWAKNFDPATADGKYPIDGENVFAVVLSYNSRPLKESVFEAHQKYIDVQIVLAGEEVIDWYIDQPLAEKAPYSAEKDVVLYEGQPEHYGTMIMEPGFFALFHPHDVHRPCRALENPAAVRKLVLKVKV